MMRSTLPIVYVLLTLCSRAGADSFLPFVDRRIGDPTGAYYVLLKRSPDSRRGMKGDSVDVLIVKRARGVSAGRVALRQESDTHSVSLGPGDEVVGRAVLEPPPAHVLVSSSGSWVVFLDSYGHNFKVAENKEPAVRVLGRDGKVVHTITLGNLFRAEVRARFERTAGGNVFWLRSAWIDEARAELIVVGGSVFRRTVLSVTRFSVNTGQVRVGGRDELLRALSTKNPVGLVPVLDLVMELGLQDTKQLVRPILVDCKLPLAARVRAAVFLSTVGEQCGHRLVEETALQSSQALMHMSPGSPEEQQEYELYAYAVTHLPKLLGSKAIPVLSVAAKRQGYPVHAYQAFEELGVKSVPTLVKLLRDGSDPDGQMFAADLLGQIASPDPSAVDALIRALASRHRSKTDRTLRGAAATSLGEIGPKATSGLPALLKLTNDEDESVRQAARTAIEKINR